MQNSAEYTPLQEKSIEHRSEGVVYSGPSPGSHIAALSFFNRQGVPKTQQMHVCISFLVVICLGCLGSLSLAPYLLPGLMHAKNVRVQIAHTVTPPPTRDGSPFLESECTATPDTMQYLPSSGTADSSNTPVLPSSWLQAGRSQKDFANAQACAASFIDLYQTFSAGDPKTFETGVSLLTPDARKRFYGRAGNKSDIHMDRRWRAVLFKQRIQQTAQAGQPILLETQYSKGTLLVWLVVPYQVTIQAQGSTTLVRNGQITVLLLGVPSNAQQMGTGWQVSQWQEGDTVFKPARPL